MVELIEQDQIDLKEVAEYPRFMVRNEADPKLYWSAETGWVDYTNADTFLHTDVNHLELPKGGQWVKMDETRTLVIEPTGDLKELLTDTFSDKVMSEVGGMGFLVEHEWRPGGRRKGVAFVSGPVLTVRAILGVAESAKAHRGLNAEKMAKELTEVVAGLVPESARAQVSTWTSAPVWDTNATQWRFETCLVAVPRPLLEDTEDDYKEMYVASVPPDFTTPPGVSPEGHKAWEIIVNLLRQEDALHSGGHRRVFYTPEEWRDRGEDYWQESVLVVVHDGGDHARYFNPDYEAYIANAKMELALRRAGYYAQQATSWFSTIHKLDETDPQGIANLEQYIRQKTAAPPDPDQERLIQQTSRMIGEAGESDFDLKDITEQPPVVAQAQQLIHDYGLTITEIYTKRRHVDQYTLIGAVIPADEVHSGPELAYEITQKLKQIVGPLASFSGAIREGVWRFTFWIPMPNITEATEDMDLGLPFSKEDRIRRVFQEAGLHINYMLEAPADPGWGDLGQPKRIIVTMLQPRSDKPWTSDPLATDGLIDFLRRMTSQLGEILETTDIARVIHWKEDLGAWEITWHIGDPDIMQERTIKEADEVEPQEVTAVKDVMPSKWSRTEVIRTLELHGVISPSARLGPDGLIHFYGAWVPWPTREAYVALWNDLKEGLGIWLEGHTTLMKGAVLDVAVPRHLLHETREACEQRAVAQESALAVRLIEAGASVRSVRQTEGVIEIIGEWKPGQTVEALVEAAGLDTAGTTYRTEDGTFTSRIFCQVLQQERPDQDTVVDILDSLLSEHAESGDDDRVGIVAVFRKAEDGYEVLVARREVDPEAGKWCLPGGHAQVGEGIEVGTRREMKEETHLDLEELTFVKKMRNETREAYVYVYGCLMPKDERARAGDDAEKIKWVPVDHLPELAFDNNELVHEIADKMGLEDREPALVETKAKGRYGKEGLLIVFEGIDGAGKTTQVDRLCDWLNDHDYSFVTTKWCSSKILSAALWKAKRKKELTPMLFSLLHASDMHLRYENIIAPALRKGKVVICDRYYYTSYVRDQIRDVEPELLDIVYDGFRKPDVIFHCIVPPRIAVERLMNDRGVGFYSSGQDVGYEAKGIEGKTEAYEKDMAERYEKVLKDVPGVIRLEMDRPIKEIAKDIKKHMRDKLGLQEGLEIGEAFEAPKHLYQQCGYSCGPTAIKMVADALGIGRQYSIDDLVELCQSDPVDGTDDKRMAMGMTKIGMPFTVGESKDTDGLIAALNRGSLIILRTLTRGTKHWIVLYKFENGQFSVQDPWLGEISYTPDQVLTIWKPRDYFYFEIPRQEARQEQAGSKEAAQASVKRLNEAMGGPELVFVKVADSPEVTSGLHKAMREAFPGQTEWVVEYSTEIMDPDISVVVLEGSEVIGFYILGRRGVIQGTADMEKLEDLTPYQDKVGVEGVALGVVPSARGKGIGNRLKDYPRDLGADYIWGLQLRELKNLQPWLKRRRLVAQSDESYATLQDLK